MSSFTYIFDILHHSQCWELSRHFPIIPHISSFPRVGGEPLFAHNPKIHHSHGRCVQSCRYCGDSKKSYSGFHWDYRKYVGDSGGFPKKVAKSCGDSIRILKKGVIGLHGDSKNNLSGFHLDYRKFVQVSIRIL